MRLFFECAIKHQISSDDGKLKKFNYLVESETYTEAEKNCYTIMRDMGFESFSIEKISKTDVNEVYLENISETSRYFSVKLATTGIDEESGEEVTINKYHYVILSNDVEPVARFAKGLFTVDDVTILQQKRTNITKYYDREELRQIEQAIGLTPVAETEDDDI